MEMTLRLRRCVRLTDIFGVRGLPNTFAIVQMNFPATHAANTAAPKYWFATNFDMQSALLSKSTVAICQPRCDDATPTIP
jgi:hypothetical protein